MTLALQGKGLWLGAESSSPSKLTQTAWTAHCQQAAAWGMTYIHPKVGEGTQIWFNTTVLAQMKTIAEQHHLLVLPYYWSKAMTFGQAGLDAEIGQVSVVGNIFGGIILDMEQEWEGLGSQMLYYGNRLRSTHHFTGHVFVTTYGDPQNFPKWPYVQMMQWADGYMPQAYFDVWTMSGHKMTAKVAIDWLYPQWLRLDAQAKSAYGRTTPIFPIIAMDGLPQQEASSWLQLTEGYGYCGFWYDETYPPFAETLKHFPIPAQVVSPTPPHAQPPAPAPHPVVAPVPAAVKSSTAAPTTAPIVVPAPVPTPAPVVPLPVTETPTIKVPVPVVPIVSPLPVDHPVPIIPPPPPPLAGEEVQRLVVVYDQQLSDRQLQMMWNLFREDIVFSLDNPLCALWVILYQKHPYFPVGSPIAEGTLLAADGTLLSYIWLSSGQRLWQDPVENHVWCGYYQLPATGMLSLAAPAATAPGVSLLSPLLGAASQE